MVIPYHTSPRHRIFNVECLQFLQENLQHLQGQFSAVVTDPPFNIGQDYDTADDNRSPDEYNKWYRSWFYYATRCLKSGGIFAINVPDDLVALTLQCAEEFKLQRIDWIIWHYKFGQCHNHSFISSHTHILVFASDFENSYHTWNPDAVLVPSDRSSVYSDRRTLETATPGQRVPLDVWCTQNDGPYWSRIVGNNEEKIAWHPNQLPELLIARLIRAYTNSDDLILEPFGGTGTVPVVCDAVGRRCITLEISEAYCRDIVDRLNKGTVRL